MMATFSDDAAVQEAVAAAEADYNAAAEAFAADNENAELLDAYNAAKYDFANARSAARSGRTGMGITGEVN